MVNSPNYELESIEDSPQFKILNDLINTDTTVTNALHQSITLTITAHTAPNKENHYTPGDVDYDLSLAIMALAQQLEPTKHTKLVEFLCSLHKVTATDPSTGKPLGAASGDVLWTDMPSFWYTELETWMELGGGDYTGLYQLFYHVCDKYIC